MKVVRLSLEDIVENWKVIKVHIEKGLKHSVGETGSFDIFHWLMSPEYAQCWMVLNDKGIPVNISITRVNKYPRHTSLNLVTTTSMNGGKWQDYKEAHHVIEDFARSIGAVRIEGYGRLGWKRLAEKMKGKHGEVYKEVYAAMSMPLKEINNV